MLDVLAALIGEEVAVRRQRALERRIHRARLPKRKTLEEYDFTFPKRIPKQAILRLFDCDFVAQHGCAVFIGPTGTGKSHLLNALGYTACEKGISVRFTRVVDMINTLTTAQINGTLEKTLRQYTTPQLLLLDELGYLPIDKRGADLLFQVVAARYESGSIVVSTNRAFRDWGTIFDVDNTLATAMIDRLMHHGEAIVIQGDSYRMKDKAHRVTSAPPRLRASGRFRWWRRRHAVGRLGKPSPPSGPSGAADPSLATAHPSPLVLQGACTDSPPLRRHPIHAFAPSRGEYRGRDRRDGGGPSLCTKTADIDAPTARTCPPSRQRLPTTASVPRPRRRAEPGTSTRTNRPDTPRTRK